jgi:hypothetical protein
MRVPHVYKRQVQRSAKSINMQPIGHLVSTPVSLEIVVFSYIYIIVKLHLQPSWLHDQFARHNWKISSFCCKYPTWNHDFRVLTKFEKSTKTKSMENNSTRVSMDEDDNEAKSTKKVKTRPREGQPLEVTRDVSYMDKQLEVEGMQDK